MQLPKWDFNGLGMAGGIKKAAVRRYSDRAISLCALYQMDNLTKEHARAWCENFPALIPLLNAFGREERVGRNQAGGPPRARGGWKGPSTLAGDASLQGYHQEFSQVSLPRVNHAQADHSTGVLCGSPRTFQSAVDTVVLL